MFGLVGFLVENLFSAFQSFFFMSKVEILEKIMIVLLTFRYESSLTYTDPIEGYVHKVVQNGHLERFLKAFDLPY